MNWIVPARGMVGRLAGVLMLSLLVMQVAGMAMVWYTRTEIPPVLQDVLAGRVVADYERVLQDSRTTPTGLGPDIRPGGWRFGIVRDWHAWEARHVDALCCGREGADFGRELARRLARETGAGTAPAHRVALALSPSLDPAAEGDGLWLHAAVALPDGRWLVSQQGPIARNPWRGTEQLVGFAMLTAVIPQLLLLVWLVRHYSRSLRRLVRAADRVSRGEPMPELPLSGPREMREITAAFNLMQQRMVDFVSDRTRMLAAIGHDLRTPLTALRLRAELVDDERTRESMVNSIGHMMRLVEETMRFAREDAARAAPFEEIDLLALVDALIGEQRELGRDVQWDGGRLQGACSYRCQPVLVRRALNNVVENACAYGESARVRLEPGSRSLRLVVEDDGPGMEPALLENATRPFLRGSAQANGGVGLGLAIARSCVKAHGGRIVLENRAEGGLCVTLEFPR